MNELQIFTNDTFGEVRTITREGEPWFVAADVCKSLDIEDTGKATSRLDTDELTRIKIESGGQLREVIIINEPGLYALVLGSRKPEAKAFKRWITHEVIPSIRKNGAYVAPDKLQDVGYLQRLSHDLAVKLEDVLQEKAAIEAESAEKSAAIDKLNDEIMERNKQNIRYYIQASGFVQLMDKGEDITLTEAAKEIGCGRDELINLCIRKKYLYRARNGRLLPMANDKARGVFSLKEYKLSGGYSLSPQTHVTLPGRAKLLAECIKAGVVQPMLPDPRPLAWEV